MHAAVAEYVRRGLPLKSAKSSGHTVVHWYHRLHWSPIHFERLDWSRRAIWISLHCNDGSSLSCNGSRASNKDFGICSCWFCSMNEVEGFYRIFESHFLDCGRLSAKRVVYRRCSREIASSSKTSGSRNLPSNSTELIRCSSSHSNRRSEEICGKGGTATRGPLTYNAGASWFLRKRSLPCLPHFTYRAEASAFLHRRSPSSFLVACSCADPVVCTILQPSSFSRPFSLRSACSRPHISRGAQVRVQQELLHASLSHCRSVEELLHISVQYIMSVRRRHREEMLYCCSHPSAGSYSPKQNTSQVGRTHARGLVADSLLTVGDSPPLERVPGVHDPSTADASDCSSGSPSQTLNSFNSEEGVFCLPVTMREAADFGFINTAHALVRLAVLQSTERPGVAKLFAEDDVVRRQKRKPREEELESWSAREKEKQVSHAKAHQDKTAVSAFRTSDGRKCLDRQHTTKFTKGNAAKHAEEDGQQQQQGQDHTQQRLQNGGALLQEDQTRLRVKVYEWPRIRNGNKQEQQQQQGHQSDLHEKRTQRTCRGSNISDSDVSLEADLRFLALLYCALHHLRVTQRVAEATVCRIQKPISCTSPATRYNTGSANVNACKTNCRVQGRHDETALGQKATYNMNCDSGSENNNNTVYKNGSTLNLSSRDSEGEGSRTNGHPHLSEYSNGSCSKRGHSQHHACSGTSGTDTGSNRTGEISSCCCTGNSGSTTEGTLSTVMGASLITTGSGGHPRIMRAQEAMHGKTPASCEEHLQSDGSSTHNPTVHTAMAQLFCSDVSSLAVKRSSVSEGSDFRGGENQHEERDFQQQKEQHQDVQQVCTKERGPMGLQQRNQQQADGSRVQIGLVSMQGRQEKRYPGDQQQPQQSLCPDVRQHRQRQELRSQQCGAAQRDEITQDAQRMQKINCARNCCKLSEDMTVLGTDGGDISAAVLQPRLRFLAAVSWAGAKLQLYRMHQQLLHRSSTRASSTGKGLEHRGEAKTNCSHQENFPGVLPPVREHFGLSPKRPAGVALHGSTFPAGEFPHQVSAAKQKVFQSEREKNVLNNLEENEINEKQEAEPTVGQNEEDVEHPDLDKRYQQEKGEEVNICTFDDGAPQQQALELSGNSTSYEMQNHDIMNTFSPVLAEIVFLLKKTVGLCLPVFSARTLSVALWSVAQLQPDLLRLQQQQQRRETNGEAYSGNAPSSFLHADKHVTLSEYKRVAALPKNDRDEQTKLRLFWRTAAESALRCMHDMTLREIATIVHAFAAAKFEHEKLLSVAADRAAQLLSRAWGLEQHPLRIQQYSHQSQLDQDRFHRREQLSRLRRVPQQRVKSPLVSQEQQCVLPCCLHRDLRLQQQHLRQEPHNDDQDLFRQQENQHNTVVDVYKQQLRCKQRHPQHQPRRIGLRQRFLQQHVDGAPQLRFPEQPPWQRQCPLKAERRLSTQDVSQEQHIGSPCEQEHHPSQPDLSTAHKLHSQPQQLHRLQPISQQQQRCCLPADVVQWRGQQDNLRLQEQREPGKDRAHAQRCEESGVWKRRTAQPEEGQLRQGEEQTKREGTERTQAGLVPLFHGCEMRYSPLKNTFLSQKKESIRLPDPTHYEPPFLVPTGREKLGSSYAWRPCPSKPSHVVTSGPDELQVGPFFNEGHFAEDRKEQESLGGSVSIMLSSLVKFRSFPPPLFSTTALLLLKGEQQMLSARTAIATSGASAFEEGISAIETSACSNSSATAGSSEVFHLATAATASGSVNGGNNDHQASFSALSLPLQHPSRTPSRSPPPLVYAMLGYSPFLHPFSPSSASFASYAVALSQPLCAVFPAPASASDIPPLYAVSSPENNSTIPSISGLCKESAEMNTTSDGSFAVKVHAEYARSTTAGAAARGGRGTPDCASCVSRQFSSSTNVYGTSVSDPFSSLQLNQLLQHSTEKNFLLSLKPIEATAMAWAFAHCGCPDTTSSTTAASAESTGTTPFPFLMQLQHASAQTQTQVRNEAEVASHNTVFPLRQCFPDSPSYKNNESHAEAKEQTNARNVSFQSMATSPREKGSLNEDCAKTSRQSSGTSPSPFRESVPQIKLRQGDVQQLQLQEKQGQRSCGQQAQQQALSPRRMSQQRVQQAVEERTQHAPQMKQQQRQKQQQPYAQDKRERVEREHISKEHIRERTAEITPISPAPWNRWTAFFALRALSLHAFIFTHTYTIVDRVRLCWALALQDVYIPLLFTSVIHALEQKEEEVQRHQQRERVQEEQPQSPPAGTAHRAAVIDSANASNKYRTKTFIVSELAGKETRDAAAAVRIAALHSPVGHAVSETAHSIFEGDKQRAPAGGVPGCGRNAQHGGGRRAAALSVCVPPQDSVCLNDAAAHTHSGWEKQWRAKKFVDTWNNTSTYNSSSKGRGDSEGRRRGTRKEKEAKERARDNKEAKDQVPPATRLQRRSGNLVSGTAHAERRNSRRAKGRQNEKCVFAGEGRNNVRTCGLSSKSIPAADLAAAGAETGTTARVAMASERLKEKTQMTDRATDSEATAENLCSRSSFLIWEKANKKMAVLPNSAGATSSRKTRCSGRSGKCAGGCLSSSGSTSNRSWTPVSNRSSIYRTLNRTGFAHSHGETTGNTYSIKRVNDNTDVDKKSSRSRTRNRSLQGWRSRVKLRKGNLQRKEDVSVMLSLEREDFFASAIKERDRGRCPGSNVGSSTTRIDDRAHATGTEKHRARDSNCASRRHRSRQLAMSCATSEATSSNGGTAHVKERSIQSLSADNRFVDAGPRFDDDTGNFGTPGDTSNPCIQAGNQTCAAADRAFAPRSKVAANHRSARAEYRETRISSNKGSADGEKNVAALIRDSSTLCPPSEGLLTDTVSPYNNRVLPYQLQTQFYLALLCYLTSTTSNTGVFLSFADRTGLACFRKPPHGSAARSLLQSAFSDPGFSGEGDCLSRLCHAQPLEFDLGLDCGKKLHETQPLVQYPSTCQPGGDSGKRSPSGTPAAARNEQSCRKSNFTDWKDSSLTVTRDTRSATAHMQSRAAQRMRIRRGKNVVNVNTSKKSKCARRRLRTGARFTPEVHRRRTVVTFTRRCTSGTFNIGERWASKYAIPQCGRFHGGNGNSAAEEGGKGKGRKQRRRQMYGSTDLEQRRLQDQHIQSGARRRPKQRLRINSREEYRAHATLDQPMNDDGQMQHRDLAQSRELPKYLAHFEGRNKHEDRSTHSSLMLQHKSVHRPIVLRVDNRKKGCNELHGSTELDEALRSASYEQTDGGQQSSSPAPVNVCTLDEAREQEPRSKHPVQSPDLGHGGFSLHMHQDLGVQEHTNLGGLKQPLSLDIFQQGCQPRVAPWHLAFQKIFKFADVFFLKVLLRCRASLDIHPSRLLACRTSRLHVHVLIVLRRLMQEDKASTCTTRRHCDGQAAREFLPSRLGKELERSGFLSTRFQASSANSSTLFDSSDVFPTRFGDCVAPSASNPLASLTTPLASAASDGPAPPCAPTRTSSDFQSSGMQTASRHVCSVAPELSRRKRISQRVNTSEMNNADGVYDAERSFTQGEEMQNEAESAGTSYDLLQEGLTDEWRWRAEDTKNLRWLRRWQGQAEYKDASGLWVDVMLKPR